MTDLIPPPVRQMIREAVENLGSPTTNTAIRDWIEARYPGTNRGTIQAQTTICTVNQPSRVHYPENHHVRLAEDPRYDFLYRPDRGKVEWYRPERHGVWSIGQDSDGTFAIRCDDGEFIYPHRRGATKTAAHTKPKASGRPPLLVLPSQVEAAGRLHHRTTQWESTDRAFELLSKQLPGFSREACILKAAAINDLYSTRVYAIWRMAEHLHQVMTSQPPDDPVELVKAIAALPSSDGSAPERMHWSFASKIGHFFIDGDRYPIYDSYCRDMLAFHLGPAQHVRDQANPYRAFLKNIEKLRALSGLSSSLRDMDRYLWLTGQYREWLRSPDDAVTNSELRSLFQDNSAAMQDDLRTLLPQSLRAPASANVGDHKPVRRRINIDADPFNADWPKRTWDLGIDNVEDLRRYIQAGGMTIDQFKALPVYVWNVDKLTWLREL